MSITCTEAAIIPLEAITPQADWRLHTDIHFWDLSSLKQANHVTRNDSINPSEAITGPENTENNCPDHQLAEITQLQEPNEEDVVFIDLKDWLIIDETGHNIDINQILPPTDPNYDILEHLEID